MNSVKCSIILLDYWLDVCLCDLYDLDQQHLQRKKIIKELQIFHKRIVAVKEILSWELFSRIVVSVDAAWEAAAVDIGGATTHPDVQPAHCLVDAVAVGKLQV